VLRPRHPEQAGRLRVLRWVRLGGRRPRRSRQPHRAWRAER